MSFVDSLFGNTPEILAKRSQRFEMLSSNLANADTPGYKAVDIDFESVFAKQSDAIKLASTSEGHLLANGKTTAAQGDLPTIYRGPHQYRQDGHTVETDMERMEFMDNAIRYQAGLNLLDGKIKSIISTLRGE